MKKILFILLLLFPFMVKAADIEVKNIEQIEKSDGVSVNTDPAFTDTNLALDLSFTNINDSIKYKITIKNNTNENLEINKEAQYGKNSFIKYQITYEGKDNILKAKGEKTIYVLATYNKEIPLEEFENGIYDEQGIVELFVTNSNVQNPKTVKFVSTTIVAILLLSVILFLLFNAKRKDLLVITLVVIATTPFIVSAVKKINFSINTKIHIADRCYRLNTEIGSFSDTEDLKEICINFDNNQYVYAMEGASAATAEPKEGTNILMLYVSRTYMTENSYVNVYDNETNELLKEVTLANFPKSLLQVTTNIDMNRELYSTSIGTNYTREKVRVELSEDLEPYRDEVYSLLYTSSVVTISYKGPWLANQDIISQINHLSIYNTPELAFQGFKKDENDSHLYHAVWAALDMNG